MNSPLKKSAGVALITVLLVVAAATIAAVSISSRLQVDIRRTENLLRADQAWQHVLGMESWAKGQLVEDFKNDHKNGEVVDSFGEDEEWTDTVEEAVEGGTVKGKIIDQQGLFNLNNLLSQPLQNSQNQQPQNSQDQQLTPSPIDIERFRRLLNSLELDEDVPVDDLVDALVDWLDANSTPTGVGAEDDQYQTQESAYSTANRLMAHQSELLLVQGFTPEIYRKLAPYVTALPEHVDINVNTAKKEVLESMYEGDDAKKMAEDLTEKMEDDPYKKIADFKFDLAPYNLVNITRDSVGLNPNSSYFSVKSQVQVGKARIAVISLIKRTETGEAEVLHRLREDIF